MSTDSHVTKVTVMNQRRPRTVIGILMLLAPLFFLVLVGATRNSTSAHLIFILYYPLMCTCVIEYLIVTNDDPLGVKLLTFIITMPVFALFFLGLSINIGMAMGYLLL
jgi:hypothetical protein